jgi:6-phosphogluconolactonase
MTNSRYFLRTFTLVVGLFLTSLAAMAAQTGKYLFYVGTYTEEGSKSKGIYAYRYDSTTGEITPLGLAAETTNP